MSNFEFYRKRAKQVLRWHRDGHWPVATQIREWLPRYAAMTDREILDDAGFKLADAQALVARQSGFECWEALKTNLETGAAPEPLATRVLQAIPCLWVSDIRASARFFEETLEFDLLFAYGEPPFFAQVEKDGVRLALRLVDAPLLGYETELRRRDEVLNAMLMVELAKPLFQRYVENGAVFFQKLRTEPWGSRSFVVEDPDGNLIAFADYGASVEMDQP